MQIACEDFKWDIQGRQKEDDIWLDLSINTRVQLLLAKIYQTYWIWQERLKQK